MRAGVVLFALALGAIDGCTCATEDDPPPKLDDDPVDPVRPPHRDARAPDADDDGRPKPDKDYPSARAAGTENLFTLEEPDRGPRAPTKYVLPPRTNLEWTEGQYCEDDIVQPACVKTFPQDLYPWRVGRSKTLIAAEQVRNGAVFKTYLYERKEDGTPLRQIELDAYGSVVSARMFSAAGRYTEREPNGANALAGCGFMTYELDDRGFSTRQNCMQWSGAAMHDMHNVGAHKYKRDKNGFLVADEVAGTDGFGIVDDTGVHETLIERAARDSAPVVRRYRGMDGAPVKATSGCTALRNTYDDKGSVAQIACLDAADHPTLRVAGYAIDKLTHSNLGCELGLRHLAPDGTTPVADVNNVAGYDFVRDGHCAQMTKSCLGVGDRLVPCGYAQPAKEVSTRDARGHELTEKHYDMIGEPTIDASYESFELRYSYDAVGNLTSTSCFDDSGAPHECAHMGFHALKSQYDDAGHETEQRFFDEQMRPTTNLGTAIRRYRYDNYDHLAETRNFNAADAPFEVAGYHLRRDIYDVAHKHAGLLLFDTQEKPAHYRACIAGAPCPTTAWHAVRVIRRIDGSVEKNEFFDADRQLIETYRCASSKCFD